MFLPLDEISPERRDDADVLADVRTLIRMHQEGHLGGATMPEDVHPSLDRRSADLCHYFTLGMSLNYQRNSYSLWQSATRAYNDPETAVIFCPREVSRLSHTELATLLLRYRVGLQPNKHTATWHALCVSFCELYDGDVRNLFGKCEGDIRRILTEIQQTYKKRFPYLSGPKIANYWLYVLLSYTDLNLTNREALSVAPDTHVIQSSRRLGLISQGERETPRVATLVAERWKGLLDGTEFAPIDVHTPLWLWSKSGFKNFGPSGSYM